MCCWSNLLVVFAYALGLVLGESLLALEASWRKLVEAGFFLPVSIALGLLFVVSVGFAVLAVSVYRENRGVK